MGAFIDLKGKALGRWSVIERAEDDKHGHATWLCRCECGRERAVPGNHLRRGDSKGCKSCALRKRNTTHGESGTRLYGVWKAMRYRCGNENDHAFKYYGGRGITVCLEWDESFVAFRDWALANGYEKGLTIDRINNDGNYSPDNCRWATMKQQHRNGRQNVHTTINGRTRTIAEWAEIAGIKYKTLAARHKAGWSDKDLLRPVVPLR